MRINVKTRSRRLETISAGDILVFKNREEVVRTIDILEQTGYALYTKRIVKNTDKKSPLNPKDFPFKEEFVSYPYIEIVFPSSEGVAYRSKKMRKVA